MTTTEFIPFLRYLSLESSAIVRQYFRTNLSIDNKADDSPVTIADKKAEEKMRTIIKKEFPDHGIIGEEFGNENADAEFVWVLDPIDGTRSFISGALSFGTLIGLMKNGKPFIGVINHPILNEFLMGDNESTRLNGNLVKMRNCSDISEATLLTTDHFNIGKYFDQGRFDKLANQVKLYRNWGDCYGYYLLATGYADIMIDPIMNIWDSMALIPIIRGAGGVITDYAGNDPVTGSSIVACSKNIHTDVIKLLNN